MKSVGEAATQLHRAIAREIVVVKDRHFTLLDRDGRGVAGQEFHLFHKPPTVSYSPRFCGSSLKQKLNGTATVRITNPHAVDCNEKLFTAIHNGCARTCNFQRNEVLSLSP